MDTEQKPKPRYSRSDRRKAQRDIDLALFELHEEQRYQTKIDSFELDAIVGLSPDWML